MESTDKRFVNGIFIQKAEGMSFEEFKEYCVKKFREAGIIKDDEENGKEGK